MPAHFVAGVLSTRAKSVGVLSTDLVEGGGFKVDLSILLR